MDSFYDMDEWRRVRYLALKQHEGCCQCCGNRATKTKPLHVDHIKPRSKFPELQLDVDNLQVLCADCNMGKGAWDETDWRLPHPRSLVWKYPNLEKYLYSDRWVKIKKELHDAERALGADPNEKNLAWLKKVQKRIIGYKHILAASGIFEIRWAQEEDCAQ